MNGIKKIETNVEYLDEQIRDLKKGDTLYIDYETHDTPFKLVLANIGNFLRVSNGMSDTVHTGTGFGIVFQYNTVQLMLSWNGGITAIIDIPKTAKVTVYKRVI